MTMKKIAVGDLGEFWYGDYKEPFVQLEGAVPGYPRGVLLKDDEGRLLCAFCGKVCHNLGNHARLTHGLAAPEYKRETGLLQKTALLSERERQRSIATALRRGPSGGLKPNGPPVWLDHKRTSGHLTAEALNKSGQCHAQMLAVARSVVASGEALTFASLRRNGINEKTVRRYAGSIERLRELTGGHARWKRRGNGTARRWFTEQELIAALRGVANEIGRTPTRSDLKRFGLPSDVTFGNYFGSYGKACQAAGLPINVPVPRPVAEDEVLTVLAAYATTGNLDRVAEASHIGFERVRSILGHFGIEPLRPFDKRRVTQMQLAAEIARRLAGHRKEAAA